MHPSCRRRAYDAITGRERYLCHGYFNYQYYFETIPENANLLVIRNNHMVEDWNTIDVLIGGKPGALKASDIPVNNVSQLRPTQVLILDHCLLTTVLLEIRQKHNTSSAELYLSDSSKETLCHLLCNEIQIYKEIIRRAINFNRDDVDNTMEELRQTCPKEAMLTKCSEEKPDMQQRINTARGEEYFEEWKEHGGKHRGIKYYDN